MTEKSNKIIYLDGDFYEGNTFPSWLSLENYLFTHSLHYGGAAFEGGRCYPNKAKGNGILNVIGLDLRVDRHFTSIQHIWMQRPTDPTRLWDGFKEKHPDLVEKYQEFFQSTFSKVEKRPLEEFPHSREEVRQAIIDTLLLNVYSGNIKPDVGGYWRPLTFIGARDDFSLGVFALHHPKHFMIAAIPWGKYLGELEFNKGAPVIVAEQGCAEWDRRFKLARNYGHSWKNEAMYNGFSEMILTDLSDQRNVLEGTGENLLLYRGNGEWVTPRQEGQPILKGRTLWALTRILEMTGQKVEYKDVPLQEIIDGAYEGMAMTGTAAELTPISLIYDPVTDQTRELEVPGPMKDLQQTYLDFCHGLPMPNESLTRFQEELITEIKWDEKKYAELASRVVSSAGKPIEKHA